MSADDLMARIEQARSGLQTSRGLLSDARGLCRPEQIGCTQVVGALESIGRHTGDFFTGAGGAVGETFSDLWDTIKNPVEAIEDTVEGTIDAIKNPREALDALTEPYREAWNEGRPGEAIGRGVVEGGQLLIPGWGAVKAGTKAIDLLRGIGRGNDGADGDRDSDNDNRNDDNQADNENGSTGINEVIQGEGFTVKQSKFDYFFGRVTSSPHNEERSQQNLEDLRELGIDETSDGRERLLQVFTEGKNAPEVGRHITNYGVTITRRVEVTGGESSGAIDVKYFYPNGDLSTTPEVSTIIPKIYK